ncbi:probable WRKY transcription factor protein 1 [Pogonomyrmex barbatus]|uniref:Probable WRKY transcription factor protein 1 n=1 Tax=Pogonomyrmex barbatus TaxID=144034 RepID=A0A6I9WSV2_9HYME|nr:probable WRKY transcription factor protein 1 [Pogonomyrmex barbatus]XP_011634992.1 probable WRKY transcription factor protein 1 [Pogonomyrmex barbatus]XP_011634993.1 probable WRKY transcription factor protein 1 [Pogonomyrmex barbatus]XP_011634994.1 probable WRKY transcription factor protein 1 [Pogonomyrmex barbatus]
MCSHESITWEVIDNSVMDRMIDNSLMHKFISSPKIRRRTKVLNKEIKKHCNMKDYKHYIELKTAVLRNLINDTDTDDSSSLTDIDYDIIYSSPTKQAKYVADNSKRYIFTSEEDCEGCKRKNDSEHKERRRSNNIERRIEKKEKRKAPQTKHTAESQKRINIGWQEVIKKNNLSNLSKQKHTNISDNEENILENNECDYFKSQSNNQFLSRINSQKNMNSNIIKSGNEFVRQNHRDSAMDNELNSEDDMIFNKTKSISKRKVQNQQNQNMLINESNAELDLQASHQLSSLRTISLENSESNNELNTLAKDSNNYKFEEVMTENSINTKNRKLKLLKNVKRNLIPALEEANSTDNNKNVEQDKNVEDKLADNQSLLSTPSRHSTPLKKMGVHISKMQNLSPDALSLDQQKDSGFDDDSQDRFVKISKQSSKISSRNLEEKTEKTLTFQQLKKINDVKTVISKDCKDSAHSESNILEKQVSKEPFEEEKTMNSFQLDKTDMNAEICSINQKDKHFVKTINSNNIKKQLLSLKQDLKNQLDSCYHIQKKENGEVKNSSEEKEEISLRFNEIDKDTKISSTKEGKTHFIKQEKLYDQKQSFSPKKNCVQNSMISNNNFSEKQDSREEKESFGENQIDGNTEIYSTNQEDEMRFAKSNDSCEVQKQQLLFPKENHEQDIHLRYTPRKEESYKNNLNEDNKQANEKKEEKDFPQLLPKVTCTEILNKKYKIMDKTDEDDIKNNIEKNDCVNNNIDIVNEHTPIKKTHCPDITNYDTNNWQEEVNSEKIDTPMALETDNEEDNVNYLSPQAKKRLQQQARLNLVVSSDSSESDDECVTTETSQKRINSLDMSHCSENESENETDCTFEQSKMNITCNENNNLSQSLKSSPRNEMQFDQEVNSDDDDKRNESVKEDESFHLRVSESNISCNNEESMDQFSKDKQSSLLNKENMYQSNQDEDRSTEVEYKSECEQSKQSTKGPNAELNISCQYRPCNLRELVEDEELLVETTSASFTLTDLSEDEEAFILNIPKKVLQCNLQGQLLTLTENLIKFNKSKYRIMHKEVGTTSCIFATGKNRKPYKIVNIKNISTLTVREKLTHLKKSRPHYTASKLSKIKSQQTKNKH